MGLDHFGATDQGFAHFRRESQFEHGGACEPAAGVPDALESPDESTETPASFLEDIEVRCARIIEYSQGLTKDEALTDSMRLASTTSRNEPPLLGKIEPPVFPVQVDGDRQREGWTGS